LILVMAQRHLEDIERLFPESDVDEKAHLLKKFLGANPQNGWNVLDPYGESVDAYRMVATELERLLQHLPAKLISEA